MNLIRQIEFFNPLEVKASIHVIGIGAIGSHVAEQLVRMGISEITIWDFDIVNEHNIPNQLYDSPDIGKLKTEALAVRLRHINPDVKINIRYKWEPQCSLSGYIFMCVDSIAVRKEIVETYQYSKSVKAFFDFRMRLTDAQHYAACQGQEIEMKNFKASMDFTEEEAKAATPVSACGSSLAVLPTIRVIAALGVANFVNLIRADELSTMILVDAFSFDIQAFSKR